MAKLWMLFIVWGVISSCSGFLVWQRVEQWRMIWFGMLVLVVLEVWMTGKYLLRSALHQPAEFDTISACLSFAVGLAHVAVGVLCGVGWGGVFFLGVEYVGFKKVGFVLARLWATREMIVRFRGSEMPVSAEEKERAAVALVETRWEMFKVDGKPGGSF